MLALIFYLEAELCSFDKDLSGANTGYDDAISACSSSGFVHEKGLSCELAALHCKKAGDISNAIYFLRRARSCYEEWGSRLKADGVARRIDELEKT